MINRLIVLASFLLMVVILKMAFIQPAAAEARTPVPTNTSAEPSYSAAELAGTI